MRILVCHCSYQQPGGEAVAVENQVRLLRERGHEVVLYQRDNREILEYGLAAKARFPLETVDSARTYREVRELAAGERFDLAHVHNVFPLISPSLYRALGDAKVPIVQTVHNYRLLCPNALFFTHGEICERCKHGRTWHAVRLRCYRDSHALSAIYALAVGLHRRRGTFGRIDRFLALSAFAAGKLVESGLTVPERVRVLGNFLPLPLPAPANRAPRGDDEPYALFLGRLTEEKGIHLLADAFAGVPGLRLRIAGDGPEAGALSQRLAALAGAGNVETLGYRGGGAKWELLRHAAFTVIPSLWAEGWLPFSALESLACGVPVLIAGHGDLPESVRAEGVGATFAPGDAADLRRRALELARDPAGRREMGARGRALVEREHTDRAFYDRLMAIYREVAQ